VLPYFGWVNRTEKDKPRFIGAKLVAKLLETAGATSNKWICMQTNSRIFENQ
jgi:phosphoribosylpyrophosphate synthetase